MKPALFDYERPSSVTAALEVLALRGGDARVLAGGQSLVPMMNLRLARPAVVIDINRLAELDYHRIEGGELAIGALARHADLAVSPVVRDASPLMAAAYAHVAHGAVRNRGTLCGNLCHADPASEMPAVALAAGAVLVARSRSGARRIPAAEFFRGLYATALAADELVVEVRFPVAAKGEGWGFQEVSPRKGDFAIAAVAAIIERRAGKTARTSLAVAGVGDRARRLARAESALTDAGTIDEAAIARAADAAAAEIDAQADVNGDAAYRRDLVRTLTARVLVDAAARNA